jgi:clan AA aspartic protease (TIGR02281 family)
MLIRRLAFFVACVALALPQIGSAADSGAKDAFKDAGLVRSENLYVLADDAAVVSGIKSLHQTKDQADKEGRERRVIEAKIASKRKTMKDADKEWHTLETKLSLVQDVGVHNRIVLRMNRLLADHKEATEAGKDLEEQAGKVSTVAKTKFVDDVAALGAKADAVSEKYRTLSQDPAVKAALAKINSGASAKVALGPTPAFTSAAALLKQWQSAVDSEAIPLREMHGIHMVDALLNGEHFLLGLDTGASCVTLPAEIADKLNITPGEQDPTVQMQLADGNLIEGKQMSLKSVRVGRFTIQDVSCIVLQKGLNQAPLILGGSFLNHFIVKLDPSTNELRLTQVKEESPSRLTRPAARAVPGLDSDKTQ